jgi:hypothetical protein
MIVRIFYDEEEEAKDVRKGRVVGPRNGRRDSSSSGGKDLVHHRICIGFLCC